ncbi:MAG: basic amino acid ABC transporter substrate-binding protein [Desulfovibrio sp.]
MKTFWNILSIAVLVCVAAVAIKPADATAAEKVYVIAHDATWPPMEFIDQNKNIVGFSPELIDAIAEAAGFKIEHKNVAWDGIFAGLAAKKYDIVCSSVSITEKRKKAMLFTDPYYEVQQALIVAKDSGVTSLADLKGKPVGAQIGTTGYFAIKESVATPKSYDEVGLAIEDLKNGRLSGVVCDEPVAADYALQQYKDSMKIAAVITTKEKEFYGMAAAKDNQEFVALVNKGLKIVRENGTYDKIAAKWFGN